MSIILLIVLWSITIITVLIQTSNAFIQWFNPNIVSVSDARYFYTFLPILLNIVALFLMIKLGEKRSFRKITTTTFMVNIILFFVYLAYQFLY
jgi:hypothetical protein